ncbi:hypothetical protein E2C01_044175 [Portunus trituberculatus]|uniref:Uncharacterized protein n=1 Tax=Portunus trituberculatus TaxID=210409 RepID=A0A5B7FY45_PORTR|nr:hypothetical protein [Portunus trituberculatus]
MENRQRNRPMQLNISRVVLRCSDSSVSCSHLFISPRWSRGRYNGDSDGMEDGGRREDALRGKQEV